MLEKQKTQKDKHGIGFTEEIASTSNTKTKKSGPVDKEMSTLEQALPVPSAREPASSIEHNWLFTRSTETLDPNIVRLKVKLESDEWIKESGCSTHMTGNKDLFSSYKAIDGGNVVFGSNTKSKIIKKVLTPNTPNSSRKDKVSVPVHSPKTTKEQVAVSLHRIRRRQYAYSALWKIKLFWKDILNGGPTPRNPDTPYPRLWIRRIKPTPDPINRKLKNEF
ncbi:hypothetical protein Tco_0888231 [Tanacetum coccineum]